MTKKNRALTLDVLKSQESSTFHTALSSASTDLTCVLLSSSYINECLGVLLRAFLVDNPDVIEPMFDFQEGEGCLSSMRSRTDIAYSVGLIGVQLRENLHGIRRIRNYFAHKHFEAKFEHPEVTKLCAKLVPPGPPEGMKIKPHLKEGFDEVTSIPSCRFVSVSIHVASEIQANTKAAARRGEKPDMNKQPQPGPPKGGWESPFEPL